jgi:hypothetical protein
MTLTKGMFREFDCPVLKFTIGQAMKGTSQGGIKYLCYFHYIVHNIRLIIFFLYIFIYIPSARFIYSQAHASSINITGRMDHLKFFLQRR